MSENRRGMGGHHRRKGVEDEWLTPPEIVEALGPFDLDPCAPVDRPWPTAERHFTIDDDGVGQDWAGRVWLNPPYGNLQVKRWMRRMAWHRDGGTALVFARTETDWFFETVWTKADALLFLRKRLHFYLPDGTRARFNAGAPSVLVAYGGRDAEILAGCGLRGALIRLTDASSCSSTPLIRRTPVSSTPHPEPEIGSAIDDGAAARILDEDEVAEAADGEREVSAEAS